MSVSAHDVAAYILEKQGRMTTMKLQKLIYYCQSWFLVWNEKPLFYEKVEAWANGPVVRELYEKHKGQFEAIKWRHGDSSKLGKKEKKVIDTVLDFYGKKSSQWLSDLSHSEDPWKDARVGFLPGQRCFNEITHASMAEYYSSL
jgi:uncharacterized phage-associated protein